MRVADPITSLNLPGARTRPPRLEAEKRRPGAEKSKVDIVITPGRATLRPDMILKTGVVIGKVDARVDPDHAMTSDRAVAGREKAARHIRVHVGPDGPPWSAEIP